MAVTILPFAFSSIKVAVRLLSDCNIKVPLLVNEFATVIFFPGFTVRVLPFATLILDKFISRSTANSPEAKTISDPDDGALPDDQFDEFDKFPFPIKVGIGSN